MRELIENNVRAAIRAAMDDDGLRDTIALSYNDLEYNLPDIFIPRMKDPHDDTEYDRLLGECKSMAKAIFTDIKTQLQQAQSIIDAVLPIECL